MILTVTANPALDITYELDQFDLGKSNRVQRVHTKAGGKGINVSRVLHQLGVPTLGITTAGGATGETFMAELAASGVPVQIIPVKNPTRRTVAVTITDETTGPTLLNEPGSPPMSEELANLTQSVDHRLTDTSVLVCSGSLPPGIPPGFYATLVEMAHRHGVPAVVDTSGDALEHAARAQADLIKPNLDEIRAISTSDNPVVAARELQLITSGAVILSLGERGMIAVAADGSYTARLPYSISGNATGAGDAVVAAVAHGLAEGMSWPQRLRLAASWSAGAVAEQTAGVINPDVAARVSADVIIQAL